MVAATANKDLLPVHESVVDLVLTVEKRSHGPGDHM